MAIKKQRISYTNTLNEVESAVYEAHFKIGQMIAEIRKNRKQPASDLLAAYDGLFAASNNIRTIKKYSSSIVFSDEINGK